MKIGVSTFSLIEMKLEDAIMTVADSGADAVEIWCEPPHYDVENTLPEYVEPLHDMLAPLKMHVSMHAPFNDLNITTRYNDVNQSIQKLIVKLIDEADKLGAERITVHPGQVYHKDHIESSVYTSMSFYRSMARAYRRGTNVENQAPTGHQFAHTVASTLEQLDKMIDEVPEVGLTLDTGHANIAGLDPVMLLKRYGSRVTEVHLSNNDGKMDSHDGMLKGTIDMGAFVDAAQDTDATVVLELNPYVYKPDEVMAEFKKLVTRVSEGHF
ncbi:MAG: sugar phosphate isomerase/epimerase [Nitrososphaerota archaeon]|nr:sugar phosphate isomerase/epimerase [Ferrimicrobium acidiphilum]MDG6933924.1 sugar phosphate isomerase/epimerase [Nitrososphaerota archaeon]